MKKSVFFTKLFTAVILEAGMAQDAAAQERASTPVEHLQSPGVMRSLPAPDFRFEGNVGRTVQDSDPATFPPIVRPPKGAPNVLLILLDDVGFGEFSVFGGGVPSPNMEKLAARGLRYNRFDTIALCSPTRAALLTGRDHHVAAVGIITELATGYDGYTSMIPKSADTVAEVLGQDGYATAWIGKNHNTPSWAGNTPVQWVKAVVSHLGGSRNPMVVSWPAKIKHDNKPRDVFLHLVDIAPTLYQAAHVTMPDTVSGIKQMPLAGQSFLAGFHDPSYKGRTEQHFEIISNRSIYEDGWKANAQHTLPWRQDLAPGNWDKDNCELYNLNDDFSEANDLATKMPKKLAELKATFDLAAEKYHVYPLDDRGVARALVPKASPGLDPAATWFTYYAGATRLPESASPPIKNRSTRGR